MKTMSMKYWLAAAASAENILDLLLRDGQSLNGEWRIIVDHYETGFYDYRYSQRDKSPNPSRSETFYLDVKPADLGERVEYAFDTSPTRDVKLVVTPAKFIAGHQLQLESETTRAVSGWVQLADTGEGEEVKVALPELSAEVTARTDASGKASFHFQSDRLKLWNPDAPKLYEVRLSHGGETISERMGFRTLRADGRKILVNSQPVFLRGICIHEDFPLNGSGCVNSPEKAKQLLLWATKLGCNFVRLAQYAHNEPMTRLADELGLMVWSEVPVYWTIDWENETTFQNAQAQLTDTIQRDANRASIIIWSLANETPVSEARTRFLTRLAERARSLDNTRVLSAAMEKHSKPGAPDVNIVQDELADIVDVVAFNQYVGWYDGLPEKCGRVKWEIPYNKPVFVGEFGGDARQGRHGDRSERWTEEFQEDLYRQTLPMLDKIDGLSGMTPWILVDLRSPKRVLPGIQDGFNRKGIISSDGVNKKAFFVRQDYYRQRAGDAKCGLCSRTSPSHPPAGWPAETRSAGSRLSIGRYRLFDRFRQLPGKIGEDLAHCGNGSGGIGVR